MAPFESFSADNNLSHLVDRLIAISKQNAGDSLANIFARSARSQLLMVFAFWAVWKKPKCYCLQRKLANSTLRKNRTNHYPFAKR